jgi:hypothetical protein
VYQTHGEYSNTNYQTLAAETLDGNRRRLLALRMPLGDKGAATPVKKAGSGEAAAAPAAAGDAAIGGRDAEGGPLPSYYMIVGFEVAPCSVARDASKPVDKGPVMCSPTEPPPTPQASVPRCCLAALYCRRRKGVSCYSSLRRLSA